MESRKTVLMTLLAGERWRHAEQTHGHGGKGRTESGESNMETDITAGKADSQESLLYNSGNSVTT